VQQRSRPQALARVIGANSILNSLFMVAAALLGAVGLAKGLTVLQVIFVAALLNAAVAIYSYTLVPEFLLRFICWLLVHTLYRMEKSGAHFPESGAALMVCNHVSFVDALVISAACRRPIRFIMDEAIFRATWVNPSRLRTPCRRSCENEYVRYMMRHSRGEALPATCHLATRPLGWRRHCGENEGLRLAAATRGCPRRLSSLTNLTGGGDNPPQPAGDGDEMADPRLSLALS